MTVLYFDASSGAAGDMIMGALVDAGVPEDAVRDALDALSLPGWRLGFEVASVNGLRATSARVEVEPREPARSYRDIENLLRESRLAPAVKDRALRTLELLGSAEARIHDADLDSVHFHEVGATDAIVDIVGCSAALEHLHPERVVVSPIATGRGTVRMEHGELPLPAPAAAEILTAAGAELFGRGDDELVTPTGAAILAAVATSFGDMPPMRLTAVGYGAGRRRLPWPNVVRAFVGDATATADDAAILIETNIDDMNPEYIPDVIDALLAAGAQDAWTSPIVMKKGRPAITLSALVAPSDREQVSDVIFRETTTFGVRYRPVAKDVLEREWTEVEVEGMPVRVKIGRRKGEVMSAAPEHDDAAEVARKTGLPLKRVYELAMERWRAAR